jgi:hypothetical protein
MNVTVPAQQVSTQVQNFEDTVAVRLLIESGGLLGGC